MGRNGACCPRRECGVRVGLELGLGLGFGVREGESNEEWYQDGWDIGPVPLCLHHPTLRPRCPCLSPALRTTVLDFQGLGSCFHLSPSDGSVWLTTLESLACFRWSQSKPVDLTSLSFPTNSGQGHNSEPYIRPDHQP